MTVEVKGFEEWSCRQKLAFFFNEDRDIVFENSHEECRDYVQSLNSEGRSTIGSETEYLLSLKSDEELKVTWVNAGAGGWHESVDELREFLSDIRVMVSDE